MAAGVSGSRSLWYAVRHGHSASSHQVLPAPSPHYTGDAAALAERLRGRDQGRGAVRRRQPRALRHRLVELPPGAHRRRHAAATRTTSSRRWRRAASSARPSCRAAPGTSLAGQCCNVAVVFDCSKHFNGCSSIDPVARQARVQPGIVLDRLREKAEEHGLTFAPDPATHRWCTVGGMIGNNSCGVHSVMAGKTDDNIDELDDRDLRRPADARRARRRRTSSTRSSASGGRARRDLRRAAARSATGTRTSSARASRRSRAASRATTSTTCCPRTASTWRARSSAPRAPASRSSRPRRGSCPSPPCRSLLVLGFPDIYAAADAVPRRDAASGRSASRASTRCSSATRGRRASTSRGWRCCPRAAAGSTSSSAATRTAEAEGQGAAPDGRAARGQPGAPSMRLFRDPAETQLVWAVRESALGATSFVPGEAKNWEGWEDAAVEPAQPRRLPARPARDDGALRLQGRALRPLRPGLRPHPHRLRPEDAGGHRRATARFVEEAADLVRAATAARCPASTATASRARELLPKMFGAELMEAFRQFKSIWDPDNRMNPGKVDQPVPASTSTCAWRQYHPPDVHTHFAYRGRGQLRGRGHALRRRGEVPQDRRRRDVPVATWRPATSSTPRAGRARLLFEMMQGEVITDGFKNEAVHEALELCLSCKSCKTECPVGVDMATYKAEFLSHYYEGRRAAAAVVRVRPDQPLVGAGRVRAVARERRSRRHRPFSTWIKSILGVAQERRVAAVRAEELPAHVHAGAVRRGAAACPAVGRHLQQLLPARRRPRGRRRARGRGVPRGRPAPAPVLRPAALRPRHARRGEAPPVGDPRRARARTSTRARPSSGSSRAASPCSATNWSTLFPDDPAGRAS